MDQEKASTFTVTDKRSAFRESADDSSVKEPTQDKSPTPEQDAFTSQEAESSFPLPEPSFLTLVLSLYTHVQLSLGVLADPISQQVQRDLQQAKYNIDLLVMLQEKTKGNLSQEEEQTLEQVLYEVRMAYVSVNK